jgi:hypothetical protein
VSLYSICFLNVDERKGRKMLLSFDDQTQIAFVPDKRFAHRVGFRGAGVGKHLAEENVQLLVIKAAPWLNGEQSLFDCFGVDVLSQEVIDDGK